MHPRDRRHLPLPEFFDGGVRPPDGFNLGVATSAFQIEDAPRAGGRGPSIWDTFAKVPGAIELGESGDPVCDHFHRWRDDIKLMVDLGITSYRFSIA